MSTGYLKYTSHGNTRRKVIKEKLMMEQNNLLCHSKNLLMTESKCGMEQEWDDAREKEQLLIQLFNEQPDEKGLAYYFGTVDKWLQFEEICFVRLKITNPEKNELKAPTVYFKIPLPLYTEWLDRYERDVEGRAEKELPVVLKLEVKNGTIYSIEWVNEWD